MEYQYIDPQKITEMLFDDSKYIIEFCEAGVSSFEEFKANYKKYLLDRNIQELRKAGHKIKPGAQMMGADEVVEEYEHSKELLNREANEKELGSSVQKMTGICSKIQKELTQLSESQN